jgi:hypothetical protein
MEMERITNLLYGSGFAKLVLFRAGLLQQAPGYGLTLPARE